MPRSNMRLSHELKDAVKSAADASGMSLSEYVYSAVSRYGSTAEPTNDFGDARLHFREAAYGSIMEIASKVARHRLGFEGRKRTGVVRAALVEAVRRDGHA